MKVDSNIPINKVSWLSTIYKDSGLIRNLYTPETIEELIEISNQLLSESKTFDIIGHTSNIYFSPDYQVENMISTRRLKKIEVLDSIISCECGVPVSSLAKQMCEYGIKGFEGLIDLPGTVAAAVYGNAGCYNSYISSILIDLDYMTTEGVIKTINPEDCVFTRRSSAFKAGKLKGVILRLRFRKEQGDLQSIKDCAKKYHNLRKLTQPGPQKNIGSIHGYSGLPTVSFRIINLISNVMVLPIILIKGKLKKNYYKTKIILTLTGRRDLIPYLFNLNRFIFIDDKSHDKFREYLDYYKYYFPDSKLEIEIRR